MSAKKNILEKKVPFNLSIKRGVIVSLEMYCERYGLEVSHLCESMFKEFLHEQKFNNENT